MHLHIYICIYLRFCVCMYACMHLCFYACMYVCMYVCICFRVSGIGVCLVGDSGEELLEAHLEALALELASVINEQRELLMCALQLLALRVPHICAPLNPDLPNLGVRACLVGDGGGELLVLRCRARVAGFRCFGGAWLVTDLNLYLNIDISIHVSTYLYMHLSMFRCMYVCMHGSVSVFRG